MYLGIIKLEANLTFYANTHTPSTGAAVDADAVPGYRVYENETATPLLTGSMALLDDANTTGFYSEQIAVTAANGFEAGKSYCVRITGVVGAVTGVEVHQFDVTTRDMDDLAFPTTAGRSVDVTATGAVGIDWANVEAPTTAVGLSGTTVKASTDTETDIAALNNLDAAGVRTAVGMASANLDTQLAALPTDADVLAQAEAALVSTDAAIALVKVDTAAILLDTGTDGVKVASHTTAAKAELQVEANDALVANDLDHLIQVTAGSEEPTDGSYLDQIMHKDASQTFSATTDSLEALQENQEGIDVDVWTYATRTLTTAAGTVDSAVSGSTITLRRGDTLSASITGIGDISARTKLWFTVKVKKTDADATAIVQIEETAGMVYFNGAAASVAANGSITVDDAVTGNITIAIEETETDDLVANRNLHYDVQMLTASGVTTMCEGRLDVVLDVTRAVT